jgi:predicted outer membrane protein
MVLSRAPAGLARARIPFATPDVMRCARFHVRARLAVGAALAALATAGCGSDSGADGASSAPTADAQAPIEREAQAPDAQAPDASAPTVDGGTDAATSCGAPVFPVCSDGQILAILAAELTAHVDLATAVRASLGSPVALDLAEKLLTDDSVLGVQVEGEMRETGLAAIPGGVGREIAAETQAAIEALAAESAPAVDASYVDREVLAHLRALALIDRLLAPSVHDPRVADLLARVRDLVAQHAQAASQAQSQLEGPCASPSE